jgi:tetratricopeptide (TPR) repeat protein
MLRKLGARDETVLPIVSLADLAASGDGDLQAAQILLEDALAISNDWERFDVRKIELYFQLGKVSLIKREYVEARSRFEQALEIAEALGRRNLTAKCLDALGGIFYLIGDLVEAKRQYKKALALARELGDTHRLMSVLTNIGVTFWELEEYAEAKRSFSEGRSLAEDRRYIKGVADCLCGLGNAAFMLGEHEEAKAYYVESLTISHTHDHVRAILESLIGIGALWAKGGNEEKGLILLAMTLNHPAIDEELKQLARQLLPEMESKLTDEALAVVYEQVGPLDFDTVVAELLGQRGKRTFRNSNEAC